MDSGHYVCHVRACNDTRPSTQEAESDFVCFNDEKAESHSFGELERDEVQSQVYLLAYYRTAASSGPPVFGTESAGSGNSRRRLQRTFSRLEGRDLADQHWEQQARRLGPTSPPVLSPAGSQPLTRQTGRSLRRTYSFREGGSYDAPYPPSYSGLETPAGVSAAVDPPGSPTQEPIEKTLLYFFTPRCVDPSKCQARLLREGVARQCANRPVQGLGLCGQHRAKGRGKGARSHTSKYGVVTGPLPEAVIPELSEVWRQLQPAASSLQERPTAPVCSAERVASSTALVLPSSVRESRDDVTPGVSPSSVCIPNPGSSLEASPVPAGRRRPLARSRIVTGFGSERIEDVIGDEEQRWADGARRGNIRREAGARGRMRDLAGHDLDRSAGSAWHVGKL